MRNWLARFQLYIFQLVQAGWFGQPRKERGRKREQASSGCAGWRENRKQDIAR